MSRTRELDKMQPVQPEPLKTPERFFPRGAIFFFTFLLLFYALLWAVVYGLMITRS